MESNVIVLQSVVIGKALENNCKALRNNRKVLSFYCVNSIRRLTIDPERLTIAFQRLTNHNALKHNS